jgi:hypothetical protein
MPDHVLQPQANTVQKTGLFEAYDHKDNSGWTTMKSLCKQHQTPRRAAYR